MQPYTRRTVLAATAGTAVSGLVGSASASQATAEYEVWAADQGEGQNRIHVLEPDAATGFAETDVINLNEYGLETPHMVYFSTGGAYAAIANTGSDDTAIIDAETHEVVAVLDTGETSHFASFTPDTEYLLVDVIDDSTIVKVDADLESESFEVVGKISVDETLGDLTATEGAPICHEYDQQGRSIHTLGPGYDESGVVIIDDHDAFRVTETFTGEEVPANCGTMPHPTDERFYLTAGLPTPTDEAGEPIPDEEGVGEFYALDITDDTLVVDDGGDGVSTEGIDAHGVWALEDRGELWICNRETNDGVVVDMATDEVVDVIPEFGPATTEPPDDPAQTVERDAPDSMWPSPDGQYLFVTLRGPEPLSGDPHASTGVNPGVAVMDTETRERVRTLQPADDEQAADFHGIAVRGVRASPQAT